ncbi:uncharacterized protein LOC144119496 [Amblyomma americanum]
MAAACSAADMECASASAERIGVCNRKPRKRFRIDEDLCLVREVVAANPFTNPRVWDEVRRNVAGAVGRDVTLRGVRDRLDLLLGYFRQQNKANLRKSGTEEQYNELDQLLQEVSDMAHEFGYAPRTVPRKGSAAAPCKRVLAAPFSAAAEMRSAHNLRDEALLSMGTEGGQADDGVMSDCGGSAASSRKKSSR